METEADSFSRILAKKLLTYALGRGIDRRDNPAIDEIQGKLKEANYRFSALVDGIVNSKPFLMRARDALTIEIGGLGLADPGNVDDPSLVRRGLG